MGYMATPKLHQNKINNKYLKDFDHDADWSTNSLPYQSIRYVLQLHTGLRPKDLRVSYAKLVTKEL